METNDVPPMMETKLKRRTHAGVSQWTLRNIPEQPFCRTGLHLSPLNTTLPSLLVIGLIWHLMTTWLRVSWISKSLLLKLDAYRSCGSGDTTLFILSGDITCPHYQRDIWLSNWKFLSLNHHCTLMLIGLMEVDI